MKPVNTLVIAATAALISSTALASSHREAPSISLDPSADNTDVYAFISPSDPDKLVVIANYIPLLKPDSGPNFWRFSDSVDYRIHFDNDGDASSDIVYSFRFRTTIQNDATFLYNTGVIDAIDDPDLNIRQTYDVRRDVIGSKRDDRTILRGAPVAPWHVGDRSFPNNTYEGVARQAITSSNGTTCFAGPRDEGFFVDLHVFDLLGVGGSPTTDGLNVMSIVCELPIEELAYGGVRPDAGSTDPTSILGVYATASRPLITIRRSQGRSPFQTAPWVQVSRLGIPLINEVVIDLARKDLFNASYPANDVDNFGDRILFPELPGLLNAVLNAGCADTPPNGRVDIVGILSPNGTTPADLLRINISADQTFADTAFPNGRALTDDVTDTLLTVLCNNGSPLGDGVDANDLPFLDEMPYLASPVSGNPL